MKITGKHELEMPVSVEFEITSAPQPERIEEIARIIKKDTKLLLRTLEKMKRHGWLIVDQTDGEEERKQ